MNRQDDLYGEGARLNGAQVVVQNNGVTVWTDTITKATGKSVHSFDTGGVFGDTIVVIKPDGEYLHVAEVNAYGVGSVDLIKAMGATAKQSSTFASWGPDLGAGSALDEDVGTFNHTTADAFEWVEVDLGGDALVDEIQLTNVAGHSARLNGVTVDVLDNGTAVWSSSSVQDAADNSVHKLTTLANGVVGDTIRINQSNDFLHLAEVDIFGILLG